MFEDIYRACIYEAMSGQYVTSYNDGSFELSNYDLCKVFYDEAEAENIVEKLNLTSDGLFMLEPFDPNEFYA